jgi:spore maturation protein CgeB
MVRAGYSPSVRLFEAAACGTPIITDPWDGLSDFLEPGEEILISTSAADTLSYLRDLPREEARQIGARARARVLRAHTSEHRACELESYVTELRRQRVA